MLPQDLPTTKRCAWCKTEKPISDFGKCEARKDGLYSWCKDCCSAKRKEIYQRNATRAKQESNRYYHANREKCLQHQEEYRNKHLPQIRERSKTYYAKVADKRRKYTREWSQKNKEQKANTDRIYAKQRPEVKRAARKRWEARNAEYVRMWKCQKQQRRNAKKAGLLADLTIEQWHIIQDVFEYRCAYCLRKVDSLCQDHVIPLATGGYYTATNIVPACMSCNSRKSAS